jgi:hypothetical protein
MFKKVMFMFAAALVATIALVGAKTASADGPNIWTDKAVYHVGEPIMICYTVPGPGWTRILDHTPGGGTHTLISGHDDGTGGCFFGTVTPPTGHECLRINWTLTDMVFTKTTCLWVIW